MSYYETVLIARQELSVVQVGEIKDKVCDIIKNNGGKIIKTEDWGLRGLAYRIRKNRKGHYFLIESESPATAMHELDRLLKINEDVLRFVTIKLDEPSKGASPLVADGNDRKEVA